LEILTEIRLHFESALLESSEEGELVAKNSLYEERGEMNLAYFRKENTLTSVYDELNGNGLTELDPFAERKQSTRRDRANSSRSYSTTSQTFDRHKL
jgi:hypothetical protein